MKYNYFEVFYKISKLMNKLPVFCSWECWNTFKRKGEKEQNLNVHMCVWGESIQNIGKRWAARKKKKKSCKEEDTKNTKIKNKIKTFLCNTVEFYLFFPSNLLRYGALWNRPVIKYLNHCSTTKCSCICVICKSEAVRIKRKHPKSTMNST